ncbi:uncharacterized protein LOC132104863 [Carassius carassius]|uniref:uncharacterized protein LOC132104863 n=1 Tax=Carassius carassius TaxID=217509 RepID=UPI0028690D0B|nr:uncharacterized protein LOC132104863 [Carassius carassius]
MDGELPPWNKHGNHNSRIPFNTAGEHQQGHDMIGDSFAAGEQMTSLSSCMSGAFKALLPDYHGTSSAMSANSDKYSYSPDNHCLITPGIAVDSDFLKYPLDEASASVTHVLPLRCAQYVRHEKNQELDQGNGNWTSVIKDALEMSNVMEMEQTLSMDECGPLMDYNPIYKGPETEAYFKLQDHVDLQIAGSEKQDGLGVKKEPDSFILVLSEDISKNKDVLEMGKHEEASILDVGSSLEKEELGITGIGEHEPGFTRSSYTPFSSSESLRKSEPCPGTPLDNQSVDHNLQVTRQCGLLCKDVSPRKTASTNTGFKHAKVNDETVPESYTVYGLHHPDLQKGCLQAEITDEKTSVNSQDHFSQRNVQDERVKTSKPHVSVSTVIKQSAAYLPAKNETNDFQETSISTEHAKLSLKVKTKLAPEIQNSSSGSENHISNHKLDGIPNDHSLYVYSHPDRLYVPPSRRVQRPVINLDPDEPEEEVSDSQNPGHELPNSEITSQSDGTHLPQATLDQETTNLNSSESIEMMANGQQNYSRKYQRSSSFVETSVDMDVETTPQEDLEESFECADCTEKLTSVLGLYEHYILHAMGDAYVQVN